MKKCIYLLLIIIIVICFSACGGNKKKCEYDDPPCSEPAVTVYNDKNYCEEHAAKAMVNNFLK